MYHPSKLRGGKDEDDLKLVPDDVPDLNQKLFTAGSSASRTTFSAKEPTTDSKTSLLRRAWREAMDYVQTSSAASKVTASEISGAESALRSNWIWARVVFLTLLTSGYERFLSCWPLLVCLVVPHLTDAARQAASLDRALINFICSGLCSFFMLGNLLNRAWVPAVSGGMTMTTARFSVLAQYIGLVAAFAAASMAVHRALKSVSAAMSAVVKQDAGAVAQTQQQPAATGGDLEAESPNTAKAASNNVQSHCGGTAASSQSIFDSLLFRKGSTAQQPVAITSTSPGSVGQMAATTAADPVREPVLASSQDVPDKGSASETPAVRAAVSQTEDAGLPGDPSDDATTGMGITDKSTTETALQQNDVGSATEGVDVGAAAVQRAAGSYEDLAGDSHQQPVASDMPWAEEQHEADPSTANPAEQTAALASAEAKLDMGQEQQDQNAAGDMPSLDQARLDRAARFLRQFNAPQQSSRDLPGGPSEIVQELMIQHARLCRERDSLHLGVRILSDQLKSRAASADFLQAKLRDEVEELSEQLFLSQQQHEELWDSDEDDLDPMALEHRLDELAAQTGKAAAAWDDLDACMTALRIHFRDHKCTGPGQRLPLLAAQLLHQHQLSADIAALHIEISSCSLLLQQKVESADWRTLIQPHQHLQKKVMQVIQETVPYEPRESDPDLDFAQLLSSQGTWAELSEQQQNHQSKKLKLTAQLCSVRQTFKAVGNALLCSYQDEPRHCLCARLRLKVWYAETEQQVKMNISSLASFHALQEAELCNQITAYGASVLSDQVALLKAGSESHNQPPDSEQCPAQQDSSKLSQHEQPTPAAEDKTTARSAAVVSAGNLGDSQAVATDDAEPNAAGQGADAERKAIQSMSGSDLVKWNQSQGSGYSQLKQTGACLSRVQPAEAKDEGAPSPGTQLQDGLTEHDTQQLREQRQGTTSDHVCDLANSSLEQGGVQQEALVDAALEGDADAYQQDSPKPFPSVDRQSEGIAAASTYRMTEDDPNEGDPADGSHGDVNDDQDSKIDLLYGDGYDPDDHDTDEESNDDSGEQAAWDSDEDDLDPMALERNLAALAAATEKAASARGDLNARITALRLRSRVPGTQYKCTGPPRRVSHLAAQLLHQHQLSADIAALQAEMATCTMLLRNKFASHDWFEVMHGHRDLERKAMQIAEEATLNEPQEPYSDPDVALLMSSEEAWAALSRQLQNQESKKLALTAQLCSMRQTFRAVGDAILDCCLGESGQCRSAGLRLKDWYAEAEQLMKIRISATAVHSARQEAALCDQIWAYGAAMLPEEDWALLKAGSASQHQVPGSEQLPAQQSSSELSQHESPAPAPEDNTAARSAAVASAGRPGDSQAVAIDDAEPAAAGQGADAGRNAIQSMSGSDLVVLQETFWNWRGAAALCQEKGYSVQDLKAAVRQASQELMRRYYWVEDPRRHLLFRAVMGRLASDKPGNEECWLLRPSELLKPGVPRMPDSETAGQEEWLAFGQHLPARHVFISCSPSLPISEDQTVTAMANASAEPGKPDALHCPAAPAQDTNVPAPAPPAGSACAGGHVEGARAGSGDMDPTQATAGDHSEQANLSFGGGSHNSAGLSEPAELWEAAAPAAPPGHSSDPHRALPEGAAVAQAASHPADVAASGTDMPAPAPAGAPNAALVSALSLFPTQLVKQPAQQLTASADMAWPSATVHELGRSTADPTGASRKDSAGHAAGSTMAPSADEPASAEDRQPITATRDGTVPSGTTIGTGAVVSDGEPEASAGGESEGDCETPFVDSYGQTWTVYIPGLKWSEATRFRKPLEALLVGIQDNAAPEGAAGAVDNEASLASDGGQQEQEPSVEADSANDSAPAASREPVAGDVESAMIASNEESVTPALNPPSSAASTVSLQLPSSGSQLTAARADDTAASGKSGALKPDAAHARDQPDDQPEAEAGSAAQSQPTAQEEECNEEIEVEWPGSSQEEEDTISLSLDSEKPGAETASGEVKPKAEPASDELSSGKDQSGIPEATASSAGPMFTPDGGVPDSDSIQFEQRAAADADSVATVSIEQAVVNVDIAWGSSHDDDDCDISAMGSSFVHGFYPAEKDSEEGKMARALASERSADAMREPSFDTTLANNLHTKQSSAVVSASQSAASPKQAEVDVDIAWATNDDHDDLHVKMVSDAPVASESALGAAVTAATPSTDADSPDKVQITAPNAKDSFTGPAGTSTLDGLNAKASPAQQLQAADSQSALSDQLHLGDHDGIVDVEWPSSSDDADDGGIGTVSDGPLPTAQSQLLGATPAAAAATDDAVHFDKLWDSSTGMTGIRQASDHSNGLAPHDTATADAQDTAAVESASVQEIIHSLRIDEEVAGFIAHIDDEMLMANLQDSSYHAKMVATQDNAATAVATAAKALRAATAMARAAKALQQASPLQQQPSSILSEREHDSVDVAMEAAASAAAVSHVQDASTAENNVCKQPEIAACAQDIDDGMRQDDEVSGFVAHVSDDILMTHLQQEETAVTAVEAARQHAATAVAAAARTLHQTSFLQAADGVAPNSTSHPAAAAASAGQSGLNTQTDVDSYADDEDTVVSDADDLDADDYRNCEAAAASGGDGPASRDYSANSDDATQSDAADGSTWDGPANHVRPEDTNGSSADAPEAEFIAETPAEEAAALLEGTTALCDITASATAKEAAANAAASAEAAGKKADQDARVTWIRIRLDWQAQWLPHSVRGSSPHNLYIHGCIWTLMAKIVRNCPA
ncbi:hypothetical protein WJX74_006979 [Apatococcus lobatus]|uniref:Uncharacterized protein n=1 Tax=Apatococcus lobatus TaxID=904363 RepID=A0AAW1QIV8_9CHLO